METSENVVGIGRREEEKERCRLREEEVERRWELEMVWVEKVTVGKDTWEFDKYSK
jgi:hypothetical protein